MAGPKKAVDRQAARDLASLMTLHSQKSEAAETFLPDITNVVQDTFSCTFS